MTKGAIFVSVLGIGVVGYIAYRFATRPQSGTYTVDPNSPRTSYLNPQYGYPFTAPQVPVAQTSNQSQYGQSRVASTGGTVLNQNSGSKVSSQVSDLKNIANDLGSLKSISDSLSGLWNDVSGFFDSGDSSFFDSQSFSFNWD